MLAFSLGSEVERASQDNSGGPRGATPGHRRGEVPLARGDVPALQAWDVSAATRGYGRMGYFFLAFTSILDEGVGSTLGKSIVRMPFW